MRTTPRRVPIPSMPWFKRLEKGDFSVLTPTWDDTRGTVEAALTYVPQEIRKTVVLTY